MEVNAADRDALCPVCSGRGFNIQPMTETRLECRLCFGDGFLDDLEEREAFWACAGTKMMVTCIEATLTARMIPEAA